MSVLEVVVPHIQLAQIVIEGAVITTSLELALHNILKLSYRDKIRETRYVKVVMAMAMAIKTCFFVSFNSNLGAHCPVVGHLGDIFYHTSMIAGAWWGPVYTLTDTFIDFYVTVTITVVLVNHIRHLQNAEMSGGNTSLYFAVVLHNVMRTFVLTIINLAAAIYIVTNNQANVVMLMWPIGTLCFIILIGYDTDLTETIRKLRNQLCTSQGSLDLLPNAMFPPIGRDCTAVAPAMLTTPLRRPQRTYSISSDEEEGRDHQVHMLPKYQPEKTDTDMREDMSTTPTLTIPELRHAEIPPDNLPLPPPNTPPRPSTI
ncbi:hypothetical protein DFQ30_005213 [Apophysomyces sp. BC1015]|nr:hypothetical protein DFQ30_005213 [Apophysomyces sp. BC1015]